MGRIRTAWVARASSRELDAFLRQRAWHFTASGNYAIAADYVIRILNRCPSDPAGLLLGEVAAKFTQQDVFLAKCREAQRRLCAQRSVADALQLVPAGAEREKLHALLQKARGVPEAVGAVEEQLAVQETEPFAETQGAVRIMAQRAGPLPLVELQQPKQSVYGRGIYALTRVASGTPVMVDQPFLVQRMRGDACAHCLAPVGRGGGAAGGVPCAHCSRETYCSVACRDAAWREYHVCACRSRNEMYAAWEDAMHGRLLSDDTEESRAALACLAVAKLCALSTVRQTHPLALPRIRSLRGRADYDAATALAEVGALAVTLATALHQTHLYMEEVLSLFAIVQTNEFLLPSGTALYHGYSLLNHSCEPNCALVGSDAANRRLVTLRELREGEQLFINYNASLTTRASYADRRALCQQRHFECFCPKCVRRE
ncbi:SET and MYND domain-containing protein [Trypanosoma conorhini]|uniref:SET and MYND domain-containing protein n=1 Tax=Trypanosoma conorhini TaxID=83891 RepID=A0A3R7NTD1_9TRYP|nr:SET and MYND domain-containing protein [Trypanosoma conorhini]RNF26743.1 SET and MYND domain-containing protein [Trypanosoma conorhini]